MIEIMQVIIDVDGFNQVWVLVVVVCGCCCLAIFGIYDYMVICNIIVVYQIYIYFVFDFVCYVLQVFCVGIGIMISDGVIIVMLIGFYKGEFFM